MSAKRSNGQRGRFLPLAPGRGYFFCNISFEFISPQVCCKYAQSMARTQLIHPGTEAAKGKYQENKGWSFIHCRKRVSLWTAWLLLAHQYQNAITLVTSRMGVTRRECFCSMPTNTMFSLPVASSSGPSKALNDSAALLSWRLAVRSLSLCHYSCEDANQIWLGFVQLAETNKISSCTDGYKGETHQG